MLIFTLLIPLRDYAICLKSLFGMEINMTDDGSSQEYTVNAYGNAIDIKGSKRFRFHLSIITSTLFTFLTMVFFVGCVMTMEYYYSGDPRPNRSNDCFVFSNSYTTYLPFDQFVCNPGETIKTLNSTSYRHIICFGYILDGQSTLDIVNQLGIRSGILSLLSTFYTFLHRISHHICEVIIIMILLLGIFVILILVFSSIIRTDYLMCMTVFMLKSYFSRYRDSTYFSVA